MVVTVIAGNRLHHLAGPKGRSGRKGVKHAAPEAALQRAVVEYLTYALDPAQYRFRAGMEGVKLSKFQAGKAKALGTRPGWPDIEIKNRQTGAVRWIELKAPGGRLTPEQREFLEECPTVAAMATTLGEVEALLRRWGVEPRCSIEQASRYHVGSAP